MSPILSTLVIPYTYSLRQCIDDGFLAPYKVIRIGLDKDLDGWRPVEGQRDKYGVLIEDREYNERDYDRDLILERRTESVANRVTQFLKDTNRFAKTIIFCENINHAERMRQALVNANPDLAAANARYVMRITGDNAEGKAQLDNFIDPESTYPVIACTSRLMSTGVDAQTCHLIVLDRIINSMTEFKQIIGRGTRINEDYNKLFFTIMDFRRVTALFADPDFDGDPVQIYEPDPDDPVVPPEEPPDDPKSEPPPGSEITKPSSSPPVRYYVDNVPVSVVVERVQYLNEYGKLITESLTDYTRKAVHDHYASLGDFLTAWNNADRKQVIVELLIGQGVFLEERAERVRKRNVFAKYGDKARAVLEALLEKYADSGIASVESLEILKVEPLREFGTPMEIVELFGSRENYLKAIEEIKKVLYAA